jgi:hypothetical protein
LGATVENQIAGGRYLDRAGLSLAGIKAANSEYCRYSEYEGEFTQSVPELLPDLPVLVVWPDHSL